jgi:hypothetical protein
MKTLLTSVLALVALSASAQSVDYRFDEVKRKVLLQGTQAATGQEAHGGEKVTTGWFSYARIATEKHRAMFEIFSATDVTLSSDTPGVILTLERGRIRAAFDKITGSEPRVVQTPGALLAVRGTEFEVQVDRSGNTTVDVWEGIVEVRSPLVPEPQLVRAGQESRFGPRRPPQTAPMPDHRRRDGGVERGAGGQEGRRPRPEDGAQDPRGGGRRPPGGDGGGHQPPPTPPPPPQRPPESK